MAVVFYNEGLEKLMKLITDSVGVPDINTYVMLFTNDVTPDVTDTVSTYTQASGDGRDPIQLNGHWTVIASGGVAEAIALPGPPFGDDINWEFTPYTGAVTIYGWVVYDSTSPGPYALFGARLPSPYLIPEAGGSLTMPMTWRAKLCPDE